MTADHLSLLGRQFGGIRAHYDDHGKSHDYRADLLRWLRLVLHFAMPRGSETESLEGIVSRHPSQPPAMRDVGSDRVA
jgi:hypothetical protein